MFNVTITFFLVESPDYDKELTVPLALLKAWWPAEQAAQNAQCFVLFARECISMAPRPWHPGLYTQHYNSDQS